MAKNQMPENQIHTGDTVDYDYENDSLFFFTKGAEYTHSLVLDNIIIDFGEENYIKGVEIQNASKRFGVSKYALTKFRQINVNLNVSSEKLELNITLTLEMRNKNLPKAITASDINEFNIPSGTMAMSSGIC